MRCSLQVSTGSQPTLVSVIFSLSSSLIYVSPLLNRVTRVEICVVYVCYKSIIINIILHMILVLLSLLTIIDVLSILTSILIFTSILKVVLTSISTFLDSYNHNIIRSIRTSEDIISIWNRTADNIEANNKIR
jgi:hypothetical protein